METQLNEKVELVSLKKIENYLETTSKHLFLTEDGRFFKAFPVKIKDVLYCATLEFDGKEFNKVNIIDTNHYIKYYGNNAKSVIADILFPQHSGKKVSTSNFKAMKEKVNEVKKFIEEKCDGTNRDAVASEVKKMLVGLEVKRKEV